MNALHCILALVALAFAQGPQQPPELSAYCVLIHPDSSSNVSVDQSVLIGFYEPAPSSFGIAFQNVDIWCRYPNGTSTWLLGWENESCLTPIGAGYKNVTVDQPGQYVISWNMSYAEPLNSTVDTVNLTSCNPREYYMSTFTASFTAKDSQGSEGVAEVTETTTFSVPIATEAPSTSGARFVQATGVLRFAAMYLALLIVAW